MGLKLDPSDVQLASDGSLRVEIAALGVRLSIGSWGAGLPVWTCADGAWEPLEADPQLPLFHAAHDLAAGHPVRAFLETFPPEVRAVLPRFREYQITLLRVLALGATAMDLATSAPNLMWLLLPCIEEAALVDVAELMMRRRTEILTFVTGRRATPEIVRLVQRFRPAAREEQERLELLRTIGRPAVARELRHARDLTLPRLRVANALARWLHVPIVRRLVLDSKQPLDAYAAPALARDAVRLARLLGIADVDAALARCRTVAELGRLHDRWAARARRMDDDELVAKSLASPDGGQFPPAPVAGSADIVHLGGIVELHREGIELSNCVASYARACLAGQIAIYKVIAPERATLEIGIRGGQPVIAQLKLSRNAPASPATWEAVRAWLRAAASPPSPAAEAPDGSRDR